MAAFLFATENIVFVSAIVLMLLIGAVQAIGIAGDFDLDIHGDADLLGWLGLGWLGLGRLPLLMLLAIFLALFGMIGLIGQHLLLDFAGAMLSPLIAAPAAFLASLPLTGFAARWLPPCFPATRAAPFRWTR